MTMRHEEISRVRNIPRIVLGGFLLDTWYFSPYPEAYADCDPLFICEFCLSYHVDASRMRRHVQKCPLHHPPGNEIYRNDAIAFFEVDGHKQRTWCRNLCLLSKLFLDHKTLYYDVNPFLFYVMTTYDQYGYHLIGYFSKEKESAENYNVACILTLPSQQRKGYGKALIQFSYELSKAEGKIGSPEKPLSDLGLLSYRSYWQDVLLSKLSESVNGEVSIEELSKETAISVEDLQHTMAHIHLVKPYQNSHVFLLTPALLQAHERSMAKQKIVIDPGALRWKPPLFTAAQLRYL